MNSYECMKPLLHLHLLLLGNEENSLAVMQPARRTKGKPVPFIAASNFNSFIPISHFSFLPSLHHVPSRRTSLYLSKICIYTFSLPCRKNGSLSKPHNYNLLSWPVGTCWAHLKPRVVYKFLAATICHFKSLSRTKKSDSLMMMVKQMRVIKFSLTFLLSTEIAKNNAISFITSLPTSDYIHKLFIIFNISIKIQVGKTENCARRLLYDKHKIMALIGMKMTDNEGDNKIVMRLRNYSTTTFNIPCCQINK